MSRRHLKVIALAVLVFITLTGARRGGGGGGCGSSNSGSHGSSSSGVSSGTSGGSHGGTSSSPRSEQADALADVRITSCDQDRATHQFRVRLRITNSSAQTMTYRITVSKTRTDVWSQLGSDLVHEKRVAPGEQRAVVSESSLPTSVEASTPVECAVSQATKSPSN